MHLRRVEVSEFRKIRHSVIGNIEDGLNVVVGDNEAGKSTMLAALRAVFFERHRVGGAVAEAMQPYGGTLRPTIRVDFELDGKPWSLAKSFCQRQEASLVGPGERLTGDAVEERLAELLGFVPPGNRGSKPTEHQGTHGLLWVEQGTRDDLGVGAGRDTLAAALESEVGQVTGGERGRALIAAAEKRRDRHWDGRGRPRGEVLASRKRVEDLEREQAELVERRRLNDDKIARLAALSEILARHAREDRLVKAAAALADAQRAVAEVDRRGAALKDATARRDEAERLRAEAVERHDARQELVRKRDTAGAEAAAAAVEREEAEAMARRAGLAGRDAEERFRAARGVFEEAERHHRTLEGMQRRHAATAALHAQQAALAAAETQAAALREAVARSEAVAIDAQTVTTLTALERAVDQAVAELKAASVSLTFEPDNDGVVAIEGARHPAAEPLLLARDTTLTLGGFGRVVVRPGGGTAPLARKADAAGTVLREALLRCRVSGVDEARRLLADRVQAQAESASLAKALAVVAPKGIEALRQAIDSERALLARFDTAESGDMPASIDAATLEGSKRTLDRARSDQQSADRDGRDAAAAAHAAETVLATMTERSAAAARTARAHGDDLAAARLRADDDVTAARVVAADARLAEAAAQQAAARAALAAQDPEAAGLTLERAQRAEQEIRKDLVALEAERRDLQVELRATGQDGIGERLAELQGELQREGLRLAAVEREAAASRLLHDALVEAQRAAKDRWLGPVRRRVEPYLRLIHPDSEIRIDERTLEIEGLLRDGVLERFGSLSMGAREQVAVITRLALADVLRSAGHPAAVILDDALVNTDEGRLKRMHNVLTRAARSLQILIFTCRESDFLGLGATRRV